MTIATALCDMKTMARIVQKNKNKVKQVAHFIPDSTTAAHTEYLEVMS